LFIAESFTWALEVFCHMRCAFLPPAESLPMQSLHCYNDYTSRTTCTWQECTAARRFIQVTLHHEDNIDK
uniref:Cytokine receptor common subunit beta N-terminal domain-containing protein n=1 Tax=Chrysemys picta bellii TaxID=8478 RepID=A0A8C3IEY5_CHRPI